jgi:hypothetical protein
VGISRDFARARPVIPGPNTRPPCVLLGPPVYSSQVVPGLKRQVPVCYPRPFLFPDGGAPCFLEFSESRPPTKSSINELYSSTFNRSAADQAVKDIVGHRLRKLEAMGAAKSRELWWNYFFKSAHKSGTLTQDLTKLSQEQSTVVHLLQLLTVLFLSALLYNPNAPAASARARTVGALLFFAAVGAQLL